MNAPKLSIVAQNGVIVASTMHSDKLARQSSSVIPMTAVLALVVGVAYVAFQRIGTTANAAFIEFTQNYAGGFLAVGMTDDQPGFVVLASLQQRNVSVEVEQISNGVAGTHTVVRLRTPQTSFKKRLRGPQAIVVGQAGLIEAFPVDWSFDEFKQLRENVDCSHASTARSSRCGEPFVDMHHMFLGWPRDRVPRRVRDFLAVFAH